MSKSKHLVIGSGPAAISAVETIRSLDGDGEIRVVSKEDNLPYSPAVLPYLLAGKMREAELYPKGAEYFDSIGVTFVPGKEVVRIGPVNKQVSFRDGDVEQFDTLLIACGAEPAPDAVQGELLKFHSLDDYHRLTERLKEGGDVAVLGAGMVAMELAIALVERGSRVRIIGRGRPLRAYFSEEAGDFIAGVLTDRGVQVTTGKRISGLNKESGGFEVLTAEGDAYKADVIVSCLGVRPRLDVTEGSNISVRHGILVDRNMRTNVDGIYAAGDVAEAPSFLDGLPGVCAILPDAIAQGKVAGANIAGKECEYNGWIPMNLLKFFGHSAFSIGMAMPVGAGQEVMEKKDQIGKDQHFRRLVLRDGRLIGAMFLDVDIDPGIISYLISKRVNVTNYEQALLEEPGEISRWLMMSAERNGRV